jgi:glycosyltransferase involved in cell wall biosynthesis
MCDYLVRKGIQVTLLTEEYQPLPFAHDYPIHTIRMYSGGLFDWAVKTVWTLFTDWHNKQFAIKALQNIHQSYDLIICSAFSDFPLGAALRIAKTLNAPLVCDIRDLDEQVDNSRYQYRHRTWYTMPFRRIYRAIHIRRRNKVLQQAKTITTVSPWHADFIRIFNPNVHVIYNGFDDKQFYPEDILTKRFVITYIGSLFEWQQPGLEEVKRAVKELNEQMTNGQIVLDVHTPKNSPVSYDRLGDAIRNSSIMLVLTSHNTHGMMTTKFFEALGCEKPILCVPSDKGCLAQTIKETNAGIATDDMEEMKAFILDKYHEWQKNGFTRQNTIHREAFSREKQCYQFETLI